jgi:hypothetical protein
MMSSRNRVVTRAGRETGTKGRRHEDSRVTALAKFMVLAVQCFSCVVKVRRVTVAVMVAAQAQDLCSEAVWRATAWYPVAQQSKETVG